MAFWYFATLSKYTILSKPQLPQIQNCESNSNNNLSDDILNTK